MGRWAQRRRRGGGPADGPPAPPPPPAAVVLVEYDGVFPNGLTWHFDQPVSLLHANVPALQWSNGGPADSPASCSQLDGTTIRADGYPSDFGPGQTWVLDTDPTGDLDSPGGFTFPATGTTT